MGERKRPIITVERGHKGYTVIVSVVADSMNEGTLDLWSDTGFGTRKAARSAAREWCEDNGYKPLGCRR